MVCGGQGCCLVVTSNGLEQAFSNKFDQVGELFECSKKLEGNQEELHEKTQVALNVVVESCLSQGNWLRDSLLLMLILYVMRLWLYENKLLQSELGEVQNDWALCKMLVTRGQINCCSNHNQTFQSQCAKAKDMQGDRSMHELVQVVKLD